MKKKSFNKYLLCFLAGMLVVGGISVYAVSTIIDSKEVSYDKKNSNGSYDNVQDSIDELYKRYKDLSGEQDTIYTEKILNGADPVLGDGMIPITLDSKGNVKYANLYTPWYSYEEKKWANAVILVGNPSKKYKTGDTILEKDIESYFVWIPRYSYKVWNLGNIDGYYILNQLVDSADTNNSLRRIASNTELIDIRFGKDENLTTIPTTTGVYYTHPAFTNFEVSGLWVGKFEVGGNANAIVIKPNVYSWKNEAVGTFWKALFNYRSLSGSHNTNLDPHMMKNTEWGAVAYLSHSIYGIGTQINVNNNSDCKTGYSATADATQNAYPGKDGDIDSNLTKLYNTTTGYLASTTGNITGIYDISGGVWEYVSGYIDGYAISNNAGGTSGLSNVELQMLKYFDVYKTTGNFDDYSKRILGDATGEMGPFYYYSDNDTSMRVHGSWYGDTAYFADYNYPWFSRGGNYGDGILDGQFSFFRSTGGAEDTVGTRLVLCTK